METAPSSPDPGLSSAMDPITMGLLAMMSPAQTYDFPDFDFQTDDIDLYGILTGNNDNILDEWTNIDPEEATFFPLQDTFIEENYVDLPHTLHTDSPQAIPDWHPGNPSDMVDIPFTGSTGILPPHELADKSPLDYLFLFLNSQMIDLILECTNKYGNKLKAAATTARTRFMKWIDVTGSEFRIFLGILLLMGTIKLNRMADYWSNHYLLRLSPGLFMSRDRFFLILRALNVQKDERTASLYKIKSVIDLFNQIMGTVYYPTKEITIDESLILWKGRLSFRQYLKGKAHRYGIKLYILADAHGIILKIHMYAGSHDQLVGGKAHVKKVVMLLMEKYCEKGHSLYLDNYYTSVSLAEELLAKNTYVTGTLRANRVGNPKLVTETKLLQGESSIAYNNKKIVVTKWQDKREILFVSTEHKSGYVGTASRRIRNIKFKPAVQVRYNKYMRSVDKHDQMLSYYCCEHKSLRWYKKVLIHIIQICLINGFLLFNINNNTKITLYDFRKSVMELLLPIPNKCARPLSQDKIHLPMNLPKRDGKTIRKRCRVCYNKTKKRVAVIFGCPNCPGFPGLCLECFREYHKY